MRDVGKRIRSLRLFMISGVGLRFVWDRFLGKLLCNGDGVDNGLEDLG